MWLDLGGVFLCPRADGMAVHLRALASPVTQQPQQLVLFCHLDLLSAHQRALLEDTLPASLVLARTLEPPADPPHTVAHAILDMAAPQRMFGTCTVVTSKGKWRRETLQLVFPAHGGPPSITPVLPAAAATHVPPQDQDVQRVASFNVLLTDTQRASRADVELPYLRAQQSGRNARARAAVPCTCHGAPVAAAAAQASIVYYPDAADDFDDEDPDADLEF